MDGYMSLCGSHTTEKTIEKSRFITNSRHVKDEREARAFVAEISEKYSDASHNCYAYIADRGVSLFRFSDDGEPSGTAGMPMLEVLRNRSVVYAAVVVTRYFGGIKLGAGGLVRAYSGCVASHLDTASVKRYALCRRMKYVCGYPDAETAARYIAASGGVLLAGSYTDSVEYTVLVGAGEEKRFSSGLCDLLNGRLRTVSEGEEFHPLC